MSHPKREFVPLTIRVVQTTLGNFFGYVEGEDREIYRMSKHLLTASGGCRGERYSVIRDGETIATGRMLEMRGDMVLFWNEGPEPFQRRKYGNLQADEFAPDDVLCIEPDSTSRRPAPLFDRIYWSRLAVDGFYYGAELYLPN